MINIIAIIPANLLPLAPSSYTEPRRMLPRTNSYLLLPRAGAIMLHPMPSSASLEQAGPWRTAATLEVRDDGYLMEDIRTLARSGRSTTTLATFSHPRVVNLPDYTEANAIASIHGTAATAQYEEPVSLTTPMARPGATPPPPNPWSGNRPNDPPTGQSNTAQDPTASPLSSDSYTANSQQSLGSHDSHQKGHTPSSGLPFHARQSHTPSSWDSSMEQDPDLPNQKPTVPRTTTHHLFPTGSDPDTMDIPRHSPGSPPSRPHQPATTEPSSTHIPIQTLIAEAIAEAQRVAREEYKKELEQVVNKHQQENEAIRAEFQRGTQSLRQDIISQAEQTAQQQHHQVEALQRIWSQRDQARTQADADRHAELLRQQAADRAAAEAALRTAHAQAADQQAKTDALLQAVLLHLQESKLETTRTPRIEPTRAATPPASAGPSPATQATSTEYRWDTPPTMLPSQWIQAQLDFRLRALEQILDGQTPAAAQFAEAFHNIRLRPPRLDDLPHWQQLDLAPNPDHVDFTLAYLPVLLNVTLRMAQLQHPPIIANPLWSAQLAHLETHLGHWTTLRSQLQHPAQDSSDMEFRDNFQNTHGRPPQPEDVPTWHHILLTEPINVTRPLTWSEYQAAARSHMLHPVAPADPAVPHTAKDSTSTPSSPEAFTPLSSPPRTAALLSTTAASDPPHRTSVTTSPCLSDKRRGRLSEDRSIAQQQLKEQQLTNRRQSRRSAQTPTTTHPICCNTACTIPAPPAMGDGAICAATQHPMHSACRAPPHNDKQATLCQSCATLTGISSYQC